MFNKTTLCGAPSGIEFFTCSWCIQRRIKVYIFYQVVFYKTFLRGPHSGIEFFTCPWCRQRQRSCFSYFYPYINTTTFRGAYGGIKSYLFVVPLTAKSILCYCWKVGTLCIAHYCTPVMQKYLVFHAVLNHSYPASQSRLNFKIPEVGSLCVTYSGIRRIRL